MDRHKVVYLDGLERSGNVYLTAVIDKSMSCEVKSLRTHELDTLKRYSRINPFIVPLRDAIPSISSSKVYRDYTYENGLYGDTYLKSSSLDNIILRYKDYVEYLIESPKFFIAPFHRFTEDHNETCKKIIKFHEKNSKIYINKIFTKEEILQEILLDKNYSGSGLHTELGNFPRTQSVKKAEIEKILKNQYSKDIDYIQSNINILYQRYYDIEI